MSAIVTAPQLAPPPHSLVRAADTTRDGDPNWQRGLTYLPEAPGGYVANSTCSADSDEHLRTLSPIVDYEPFELQFHDPCETTFGYKAQEVTDRLRRLADATESYGIGHELWTGDLARAVGDSPNLYLAKDPTVLNGGTPLGPKRALGLLEEAVGDATMGGQAFLHMARAVRPFMWELEKVGQLLFTKIDNAVVCDAGYPGSAPDGVAGVADVAWVYATGPVVVRRSALTMYATEDAQVIDTATNTRYRTASKVVAATFDPATLFAVAVDLTAV